MEWLPLVERGGALVALAVFMWRQQRLQEKTHSFFLGKLNGSLDALRSATEENTRATRDLVRAHRTTYRSPS